MSTLEERLRDSYRGAADTVTPETIRGRYEPVTPRSRPARLAACWGRGVLVPLAAAAAVTVTAVLAAVVLPADSGQHQNWHGLGPASAAEPKFLIDDHTGVVIGQRVRGARSAGCG